VRAFPPDFLQKDRSISGEEFSGLDRAGARSVAIGTGLRFLGRPRLLGGRVFTQGPSDLLTDLVGPLLDGGEVEGSEGLVPREQFVGKQGEKLLELGIVSKIGG